MGILDFLNHVGKNLETFSSDMKSKHLASELLKSMEHAIFLEGLLIDAAFDRTERSLEHARRITDPHYAKAYEESGVLIEKLKKERRDRQDASGHSRGIPELSEADLIPPAAPTDQAIAAFFVPKLEELKADRALKLQTAASRLKANPAMKPGVEKHLLGLGGREIWIRFTRLID